MGEVSIIKRGELKKRYSINYLITESEVVTGKSQNIDRAIARSIR